MLQTLTILNSGNTSIKVVIVDNIPIHNEIGIFSREDLPHDQAILGLFKDRRTLENRST